MKKEYKNPDIFRAYEILEKNGRTIRITSKRSLEEIKQDIKDGYEIMVFGKQVIRTEDIEDIKQA